MTDRITQALADLVADEPPVLLGAGDIVTAGRRKRRNSRIRIAAGLMVAVPLLGGLVLTAREGPAEPAPAGPGGTMGSLLSDPGFENDNPGWQPYGPNTALASDGAARDGRQALRITASLSKREIAGATNKPVLVTTVAGTRYTATCWVRSATAINSMVMLQEYTKDWSWVSDGKTSSPVTLLDPATWYQVSVSYTPSSSGNLLPMTVFSRDLRDGRGALLVDDCSITASPD